MQSRGGVGIKAMSVTEKTGLLCGMKMVDGQEDIMIINDANVIIRVNTSEISSIGRSTQGVRLMKVGEDTKVVCIAKLPPMEEDEEE